MNRSTRFRAMIGAALLTSSLLAACSVDGDENGSAGSDSIDIALSAGIDMLDPQRSANGPDLAVMSQIYETLLSIDAETRELGPNLATSYELVEPTRWRFELRDDVTFTNGEAFDAEAVKYSIERIIDPATVSVSASQLDTVKKVEVVDDHTVDIVTKSPDAVLPRRMQPIGGSGRVFIVPPKYFSESTPDEVANNPVGTGPYKMESWDKGQSITLARNDDYWGEQPDIARAKFSFITENTTRVNALLAGEVDLIQRVPIEDVDRVGDADGVHVESSEDGLVHTLLLDMRSAPFDDIKVRQAFAHAIDVQGFVDQLLKGHGRALGVPMSPTVAQFDDSLSAYEYDPAKAKRLLAEAGYEDGLPLATKTSAGRYVADKEIYDTINGQLEAAGFEVAPQTVEWGRLISQMTKGSAGPFYMIGWDFGEGDASKQDSFLQSSSSASIAKLPEYDRLSDDASATTDEDENLRLWQEAQKSVHRSYAIGGMWQADSIYGMTDAISWSPEFGDNVILKDIEIAD
ncbi:ABC transporter substrate-binding protein [Janibacter melonis]|uniref:ABC transporter substrate-binding protein n=1 Tax=Janibacter melonis TaxID=262209 RepID=UPI001E388357|nr:ABC transporter substrate-binding protein [Janibacter melonis]MCB5991347.1 ABC transporter substrate-binding protein [Janibacter melonis]